MGTNKPTCGRCVEILQVSDVRHRFNATNDKMTKASFIKRTYAGRDATRKHRPGRGWRVEGGVWTAGAHREPAPFQIASGHV